MLPPQSATALFNQVPENITQWINIEASSTFQTSFERAQNFEVKEDIVGLGHYGKTLTLLFSEEDLDEAEEDFRDDQFSADTGMPSAQWTRRDRKRE